MTSKKEGLKIFYELSHPRILTIVKQVELITDEFFQKMGQVGSFGQNLERYYCRSKIGVQDVLNVKHWGKIRGKLGRIRVIAARLRKQQIFKVLWNMIFH